MDSKWIPVTERVPEENGDYLACASDGYITTLWHDREMGWLIRDTVVVAWMPLPEPYTGKE